MGGRSRVAAQMLAGKGFQKIYNLSGGIKSWGKEVAVGREDVGLSLFAADAGPREAIIAGFGLEAGLREFYLAMQQRVARQDTKELLGKLAAVEGRHQEQLVQLFGEITGTQVGAADFAAEIAAPALEGGLTMEEYLRLYPTDFESEPEVLGLALAIEAQALDLYLRAAAQSTQGPTGQVLRRIAEEERAHIASLGHLIDRHLP